MKKPPFKTIVNLLLAMALEACIILIAVSLGVKEGGSTGVTFFGFINGIGILATLFWYNSNGSGGDIGGSEGL